MPELETLQGRSRDGRQGQRDIVVVRLLRLLLLFLRFAFVDVITIGEEKVIGVSNTVLHAIFHHARRSRWRTQFLNLK